MLLNGDLRHLSKSELRSDPLDGRRNEAHTRERSVATPVLGLLSSSRRAVVVSLLHPQSVCLDPQSPRASPGAVLGNRETSGSRRGDDPSRVERTRGA